MKKGADITHLWDRNLTPTDIYIQRDLTPTCVILCASTQRESTSLYCCYRGRKEWESGEKNKHRISGGDAKHAHTHTLDSWGYTYWRGFFAS
mmetsp:Transcript_55881/g.83270  ORF Transcript_55881/g.83270 Transcript_55881/m.83270 type:complete len:92 (+) Transcript_55881:426-701(+)